jgi:glycosyltransferase involved in cell wall biosynthesis
MGKLTVIIPAYNEAWTISKTLDKVRTVSLIQDLEKEVIVVDDFSDDTTQEIIRSYQSKYADFNLHYLRNERNFGKGYSIQKGIQSAKGDYLIIQDADLEYDPNDYNQLVKPLLDNFADVVYGSRFIGGAPHRILFFWHSIGNRFLTSLSNIATNLNLTDMETGYKLFRTEIISKIKLKEMRFGFEPEITAKISKIHGIRIYEVGISYYGRTYQEGKKINWRDGFRAIYCIIYYNFFSK